MKGGTCVFKYGHPGHMLRNCLVGKGASGAVKASVASSLLLHLVVLLLYLLLLLVPTQVGIGYMLLDLDRSLRH